MKRNEYSTSSILTEAEQKIYEAYVIQVMQMPVRKELLATLFEGFKLDDSTVKVLRSDLSYSVIRNNTKVGSVAFRGDIVSYTLEETQQVFQSNIPLFTISDLANDIQRVGLGKVVILERK